MAVESDRDPSLLELVRAGIRLVGWRGTLHTARFALWKTRLDRTYLKARPTGPELRPGPRGEPRLVDDEVVVPFGPLELAVAFQGEGAVRLTWTPGRPPVPVAVPATVALRPAEPVIDGDDLVLTTTSLRVTVGADGAVTVADEGPDGWRVVRRERPPRRVGERWTATVALAPDDRVHGLGERSAPLDLRPGTYGLWNTEVSGSYGPDTDPLYLTAPVHLVVGPAGSHLGLWENTHKGEVVIDEDLVAHFEGGALRTWVLAGPPERAVGRLLDLTGRPPLPPRWALGYHQCRWGYRTEADVRAVLAGFQDHDLPLSAIHLDIDYMDRYRVFTVDEEDFPDLAGLTADLAAAGVETVAIVDPGVARDRHFPLYAEGHRDGRFLRLPDDTEVNAVVWPGRVGFPDFSDPAVRSWWGDQYPALLDRGVSGIWHDMNEPAVFSAGVEPTLPLATRHDLEGRGGDHVEGRNLYGLGMAQAGFEALARHRPDRRPWLLTRSGWVGVQRYAWTWTGDVGTSWTMLHRTVATALNLSLSGIPYTGPDIGGFSGDPSPELYTRWFQVAAWLPFFRSHSIWTMPSREPWRAAGPHLEAVRAALLDRYRLLPFWYTLAADVAGEGSPLVLPVWWGHEDDPALAVVDDEFLVGPNVLVAPVVAAGATEREVVLPPGSWWGLDGDGPHEGRLTVPVTMATVPVFVRAGVALPTDEQGDDVLVLYPPAGLGARRTGGWYRDAGDGHGPRRAELFRSEGTDDGWVLRREVLADGYVVDDDSLALRVHGGPWEVTVDDGPTQRVEPGQALVVGDWAVVAGRRVT